MICQPKQHAKVCIVDARPTDYSSLIREIEREEVEFVFFSSGRDALRSNPEETPECWIVNVQLPDMRGSDLQSMLQARGCNSPVMLVGDDYRMEDELEARCSGAAMYFAKPLPMECLLPAGVR